MESFMRPTQASRYDESHRSLKKMSWLLDQPACSLGPGLRDLHGVFVLMRKPFLLSQRIDELAGMPQVTQALHLAAAACRAWRHRSAPLPISPAAQARCGPDNPLDQMCATER